MYDTNNWLVIKDNFLKRLNLFKESWNDGYPNTHPYFHWIAVVDNYTAPECLALHGKIWYCQNPKLQPIIDAHFEQEIKNCRCRCSAKTERNIERDGLKIEP